MCEPTTLLAVSAAMSVASGVTNYVNQSNYQNKLAISRNQQITDNANLANASYRLKQDQLGQQDIQKDAAVSQSLEQNAVEAAKARATGRVSSGEAGVQGVSVDNLLADFDAQEARYRDTSLYNRAIQRDQGVLDRKAAQQQAEGRIQSVRPHVINNPSLLATGLQIGGGVLDAASRYKRQTMARTAAKRGSAP